MKSAKEPSRKGQPGRPCKFTQAQADRICEQLMDGKSLRAICESGGLPTRKTVFNWLNTRPVFMEQYNRAREIQYDSWADEIKEIADAPLIGEKTTTKGEKTEKTIGDNVERSKLKVDARKWLLARLAHNRFGDRITQEVTGANGTPLIPVINLTVGGVRTGGNGSAG